MTFTEQLNVRNRITGDRAVVEQAGTKLVQLRYATGPLRGKTFMCTPTYADTLFDPAGLPT